MNQAGQTLRIATCQFAETFDPRRNAAAMCRFLRQAKERQADIVHFHEACLSGYLALDKAPRAEEIDWAAVRQGTERLCQTAGELGLWVVLGSSHPLSPPHKPTNCLYLIGPDGTLRDRYDKRFLTAADLAVYSPGDHAVTFELNGLRCALLICFDLRFPELYRQLCRLGAQVIFQSFHNGYMDGPGIHEQIMRQTVQAQAGMNGLWISANNSSARFSRWPSVFVTPDGAIAATLRQNAAGMMVNTVDPSVQFYDPSAPFRAAAIEGATHNGVCVQDSRREDRLSF
ncbi:MAG: carbon-nitrogen hydrolase family protein [Phycisphaerae bacterium]|jgi:predicted amidohydrolase